jgi:hypothetical protein
MIQNLAFAAVLVFVGFMFMNSSQSRLQTAAVTAAVEAGNQDSQDKADLTAMAQQLEQMEDIVEDIQRRNPNDDKIQILADAIEFVGDIADDAVDDNQNVPTPRWGLLLNSAIKSPVFLGVGAALAGLVVLLMFLPQNNAPVKPEGPQLHHMFPASLPATESASLMLREQARKIFKEADCAGGQADGKLTKGELKKYIKAHPDIKTFLLDGIGADGIGWEKLFEQIDTDGDGNFSEEEFVEFYLKRSGEPMRHLMDESVTHPGRTV